MDIPEDTDISGHRGLMTPAIATRDLDARRTRVGSPNFNPFQYHKCATNSKNGN